ncbi:hypothetical protein F4781DRAFT_139630 [Annulohypoxylon bovei var. microspora]|nr:hypothetical protein F4781DRAFT_139630 [Annulohypoxylon bovei var. microspora]
MPSGKSASDKTFPADRASESDGGCVEENYYTPNHTEYRPPHLNDENFSSTQPGGSNTQPRRFRSIETNNAASESGHVMDRGNGNYTHNPYTPSTAYTESTLKAGDPFIARPDLAYYYNHDYDRHDGNRERLTMQAIAAHDRTYETGYYGNNVNGWAPHQVGFNNFQPDSANNWSTSHLILSSGPRSQASTTTNNYVLVSSTPDDFSSEMIRDAGSWQYNIPADPRTSFASDIPDEDILDA